MIRSGVIISVDDSKNYQRAQVETLGKVQTCELLVPFGSFGNPEGVRCIILPLRNKQSELFAIPTDPVNRIKKDTLPSENGIGNNKTGSNILLEDNGDIDFVGTTLKLNGDSKSFVTHAELDAAIQTFLTALNAHIHVTTATVSATTVPGVIAPTTPPITLDISASKTTTVKTDG
jgi:phage gp45-like